MRTAQCLCGAIKLEITGEPLGSGACFCPECQKTAGGGPAYAAVFEKDTVRIVGEPAVHWTMSKTGNRIGRAFCPDCGTPLFGLNEAKPGYMPVMAGALDDPAEFKIMALSWVKTAQPWHHLDPGVPAFDGNIPE